MNLKARVGEGQCILQCDNYRIPLEFLLKGAYAVGSITGVTHRGILGMHVIGHDAMSPCSGQTLIVRMYAKNV